MALFITFEGGEGTGKTTQVQRLVERLQEAGQTALALREPGGTPLGDYLRVWLKAGDQPLTPTAELLLFAAARAELVRTLIKPALELGTHIILDRYADSTLVYQGYGRRLPMAQVRAANKAASDGLVPDITLLLDGPVGITLERAFGREDAGERRFEGEDLAFHLRVRAGFLRLAKQNPERWAIVNATGMMDQVHETIWDHVQPLLTT